MKLKEIRTNIIKNLDSVVTYIKDWSDSDGSTFNTNKLEFLIKLSKDVELPSDIKSIIKQFHIDNKYDCWYRNWFNYLNLKTKTLYKSILNIS